MTKLLSFPPILLVTRLKCVSKDYKNIKKKICQKKMLSTIVNNFFFFAKKSSETRAKKIVKIRAKKKYVRGYNIYTQLIYHLYGLFGHIFTETKIIYK